MTVYRPRLFTALRVTAATLRGLAHLLNLWPLLLVVAVVFLLSPLGASSGLSFGPLRIPFIH